MTTSHKYRFDKEAAAKAVNWIEKYCTHVKGEWSGAPFILSPWQKEDIIKPLFGWKETETGLRKYRRAFIFVARKNGKSTLGSAIALYLLCGDGEGGAEIYSAASDRLQAGIIHSTAKTMVLQNEELSKRINVFQASIEYKKTASFYRVLSSDAPRQHGKNSHGIIFDELHTQPDRELWDVLTTSVGARRQPLICAFSTAGFDRNTICYEQYDYAKKVRDGIIEDEAFLPVIYESLPEDDISVEETWKKANPGLGISLKDEYVKNEAIRAMNEPTYENTFRRLQLNQWTSAETKWIQDDIWMQQTMEVNLDFLKGKSCVCGLDLASRRDITAFVQLFPVDDKFVVVPWFFVPELTAKERVKKDGVNYDQWIKQGFIIESPGNVTDYDYIRKKINELNTIFEIRSIGYDRWNSSQLIIDLQADGLKCNPFGQGFASMSSPTKEVEAWIYSGKIIHGGNPVLRWMCSNVMIVQDAAGNMKVSKEKSREKVDGIVGMIMAAGEYMTGFDKDVSVYNTRGVVTL